MKWFTVSRRPRPKQLLHRRRVTCRLQLEALEDRCLLSSANGLVLTSTVTNITSGFDVANGLGLQSTGQIIVAGTANETGAQITNALGGSAGSQGAGTGLFALARYNSDSSGNLSLDTAFGSTGVRTTSITSGKENEAQAMAIYGAGTANADKIVLAGWTATAKSNLGDENFAVASYTSSGTLDTSFGSGKGYITTNVSGRVSGGGQANDHAQAVAIDAAGKIVVAGYATTGSYTGFAVARYTSSGALDTTFNASGTLPGTIITSPVANSFNYVTAVAVQADGKIVVAGVAGAPSVINGATDGLVALERFNANGTVDTTFGTGGVVTASIGNANTDGIMALAIDASGNIVVGGKAQTALNSVPQYELDFLVARFTSSGTLDTTFNSSGYVLTSVDAGFGSSAAYAVAIQTNGQIVAAGYTYDPVTLSATFALARYNSNGSLDTGFNGTGMLTYGFPGANWGTQVARGVAITSTGAILAAGGTNVPVGGGSWSGDYNFGLLDPPGGAASEAASAAALTSAPPVADNVASPTVVTDMLLANLIPAPGPGTSTQAAGDAAGSLSDSSTLVTAGMGTEMPTSGALPPPASVSVSASHLRTADAVFAAAAQAVTDEDAAGLFAPLASSSFVL